MKKLLLMPLLLALGCLVAGLYGACHNQISYTVSPEYFTQFKFEQFGLGSEFPPRLGAAIVGWQASWWMGIVIGVVLLPAGLVIRGPWNYFRSMLATFVVVAMTTLLIGLAALSIAFVLIDPDRVGEISRYGNQISDGAAFLRAGAMHNFSYAGGLLGVITGLAAIVWAWRRQRATAAEAV